MTSFQDKLDALPEFPKSYLDGDYESEPTAVRHVFRARLALAREFMAHHSGCAEFHGRDDDCTCGLDAFMAKLDSEGL